VRKVADEPDPDQARKIFLARPYESGRQRSQPAGQNA
jgi:hypothetical protein